ncbi:MAG: tetratricopeptide repeat protein [Candidatus Hinthialibacter antarcticus]|nr:tetratricopeptide repeat protein [Candidatus Hinthialibacter antarcticus]
MLFFANDLKMKCIFASLIFMTIAVSGFAESVTPATVLDYTLKQIDGVAGDSDSSAYEYARGMAYFRAVHYEDSLQAFQRAFEMDPRNSLFLGMIANCYFHLHQYEDAVEWYRKTVLESPAYPKGFLRLGLSLERLNRPDEALQVFQTGIKETPGEFSSLYYAARILFDQNKLDESLQWVQTLRSKSDEYTEPIYLQAQIARKQGDMEAAKALMVEFQEKRKQEHTAFDEAPRMSDDVSARRAAVTTHFDLAQILFELDKDKDAIAQLDAAIALAPNDIDARLTAVNLAMERKENRFVETQLRWLTKTKPNNGEYAFRLGVLLGLQKRYDEAEPFLQRAVSLTPDNVNALRGLVDCLVNLRRDPKIALSLSQDAVELDPSAISYDLLSRLFYINGRINESIDAMQNAVRLEPNNPVYKKRYQALLSRRKQ